MLSNTTLRLSELIQSCLTRTVCISGIKHLCLTNLLLQELVEHLLSFHPLIAFITPFLCHLLSHMFCQLSTVTNPKLYHDMLHVLLIIFGFGILFVQLVAETFNDTA